jgi:hypothetical protein
MNTVLPLINLASARAKQDVFESGFGGAVLIDDVACVNDDWIIDFLTERWQVHAPVLVMADHQYDCI